MTFTVDKIRNRQNQLCVRSQDNDYSFWDQFLEGSTGWHSWDADYLFVCFFKSGYKVVCENSLHFTLMACALPVCDFIFQSEALKELVLFFLIELRNPKSSFGYRSKIWKCTM